jgi:hypothetical protein
MQPRALVAAGCVLAAACTQSTPAPGDAGSEIDAGSAGDASVASPAFDASVGAPVLDAAALLEPIVYRDAERYAFDDAGALGDEDGGVALELTGPNTILVVVDRSGSMDEPWDDGTRWTAGNAAMVAALLPFREQLTLAGLQFPLQGDCEVPDLDAPGQYPFTSGTQFLGEWSEHYPRETPLGATPLEAALAAADRAIDAAIAAGLFEHKFKVMLITDGQPTCADDTDRIVGFPARWLERGVRTYVLGLPGSGPAEALLESIAAAGGTGSYRPVGDPRQLQDDIAFAATE